MFDLARRFALLESAAGPSTVRIAKVVAAGRSAACARCSWRVLATDAACENCGLARSGDADDTVGLGLPAPAVTVRSDAYGSGDPHVERLALDDTGASPFSRATEWTGREVWRCGPKTFRHRVASLVRSLDAELAVDVLCMASARARWTRATRGLDRAVRILTPRSLVSHAWDDAGLLVVDAPAAFDPASSTFRRLANAPHRFVIARASEKRFAGPDSVFALTDLVTPGTFASVVEARALHRGDRAAFVDRRDSVVVPPGAPALARDHDDIPSDATEAVLAAIALSGVRVDRRIVLLVRTPRGITVTNPSAAPARIACESRSAGVPPRWSSDEMRAVFATDVSSNARVLASSLARLARAYAERIDLAPRAERKLLADEFARRADCFVRHGTLRICIDLLASVTLRPSPRP